MHAFGWISAAGIAILLDDLAVVFSSRSRWRRSSWMACGLLAVPVAPRCLDPMGVQRCVTVKSKTYAVGQARASCGLHASQRHRRRPAAIPETP